MNAKKRHSTHLVCLNFAYMKRSKIFQLLMGLVFFATGTAIAQPEVILEAETVYVYLDDPASEEITTHATVSNNQFGTIELMCSRNYIDVVNPYNYPYNPEGEGSYEKFCWGPICYNYGADASNPNSGFTVGIPNGDTDTTFIAYFYPNGVTGSSTIEYCFHPVGNTAGGTCIQITYIVEESASVGQTHNEEAEISSVYPNPIINEGFIDFVIPEGKTGEIIARDLTGNVVSRFSLLNSEGRVIINTSDLSPGLYFTTLEIDGTVTETKRFVVAK